MLCRYGLASKLDVGWWHVYIVAWHWVYGNCKCWNSRSAVWGADIPFQHGVINVSSKKALFGPHSSRVISFDLFMVNVLNVDSIFWEDIYLPINFFYSLTTQKGIGFAEVFATEETIFGRTGRRMNAGQYQMLSLIHIWRCRRSTLCRSRWSPYH